MIKRGNYLDILERKEVDSVENGTVSKSIKFYIDTYNLYGNLISSKYLYTRDDLIFPIGIQQMFVKDNKTYVLDMDSDYFTLRIFQYDGTNVVSKTISPIHYWFDDALFQKAET